jgi:hypothetical protein
MLLDVLPIVVINIDRRNKKDHFLVVFLNIKYNLFSK